MDMFNLAGAVILSGIVIVFVILVILIICVAVVGKAINASNAAKAPPVKPAAPAKAPAAVAAPPKVEGGIDDETVAVISAAVAAMSGGSEAVYSVSGVKRTREARPVWGFAGMQQNTRPF